MSPIGRTARTNNSDARDSGDDHESFFWEEESTLFSDLMDDGHTKLDDEKLNMLAESIQGPFSQQSRQLKKEIAETFVPTVNQVKKQYAALHDKVDVPYGSGLLVFNKACKEMEMATLQQQDVLRNAYMATQNGIDELLKQLEDEYKHREQLWTDFERNMNEHMEAVFEALKDTPGTVERTISDLEKRSKALEKKDGSGMLKDELRRLMKGMEE